MTNSPYAAVTDNVLATLAEQAHDAHCAAPLCKPFRADLLANMVHELQCWRTMFPQATYDPETKQLVNVGPNR